MKENIISDLNADLKKEKDILVDIELRFGGLNNKINKLKKESVWEDEEQLGPLIMFTLGGIIGIFIVYLEGGIWRLGSDKFSFILYLWTTCTFWIYWRI